MPGRAKEKEKGSLESSKAIPFVLALKREIKAAFGSNRAFALRLGVTEGRISQLLSGEIISPYTLEFILSGFEELSTREAIYQAWLISFAPSPFSIQIGISDESISTFLSDAVRLRATGKARQVIETLESLLSQTPDQSLRFLILEEASSVSLFLGRTTKALSLASQLLTEAKSKQERGWIAKALYLRANVSRTMHPPNPQFIAKCHQEAHSFAKAHENEIPMCKQLAHSLDRDFGLAIVAIGKQKPLDDPLMVEANSRLELGIQSTQDIGNRLLWIEAKMRLLLLGGDSFGAEEALEEIAELRGLEPIDFGAKERLSRASLLIARGQIEEAESILLTALDECLAVDNLHHAGRVEHLLSRILAARLLL